MNAVTLGNDIQQVADAVNLTPDEGASLIEGAYISGTFKRTPLFRGSPGIGKTSFVKQAAAKLAETIPGFDYIEINPTMPADEVGGIPELIRTEGEATRTDYALPKWFPTDPEWKGIINLDDGLQGDKFMQQVLANLIHARNLRGNALPKGAMIVVTGNRVEDGAGVQKTLTHFADRMCSINIVADADSWIENYAIPKGLDQRIITYILRDKSKLDQFDPKLPKCATPRSWEAVSNWLKYIDTLPAEKRSRVAQVLLAGEIGQGEALKFWAFCELFEQMPDPKEILKDPANSPINFEIDVQYALVVALANMLDEHNYAAALEYTDRLGADFSVLLLKIGTTYKPKLRDTDAHRNWAVKNQAAFKAA